MLPTLSRYWEGIRAYKISHPIRFWNLSILFAVVVLVVSSSMYLLSTSPYSRNSIVEQPFTTSFVGGKMTIAQHYTPHVYGGWWATMLGYYKQAITIVWNRIESPKMPGGSEQDIIRQLHVLRFDPSKPYVISGDQFDALYLRNLGVFYQDLLNKDTALSESDWQNRQRIVVQTVAYGLSAMEQTRKPMTALFPISSTGVLAVNVYGYPSDTLFSFFQTIQRLEADPTTRQVAEQVVTRYHDGLVAA